MNLREFLVVRKEDMDKVMVYRSREADSALEVANEEMSMDEDGKLYMIVQVVALMRQPAPIKEILPDLCTKKKKK